MECTCSGYCLVISLSNTFKFIFNKTNLNAPCQRCEHNTYGDKCQYCLPGFVGDATRGTPHDCTLGSLIIDFILNLKCYFVKFSFASFKILKLNQIIFTYENFKAIHQPQWHPSPSIWCKMTAFAIIIQVNAPAAEYAWYMKSHFCFNLLILFSLS